MADDSARDLGDERRSAALGDGRPEVVDDRVDRVPVLAEGGEVQVAYLVRVVGRLGSDDGAAHGVADELADDARRSPKLGGSAQ